MGFHLRTGQISKYLHFAAGICSVISLVAGHMCPDSAYGDGSFLPVNGAQNVPVEKVVFTWPAHASVSHPLDYEHDAITSYSQTERQLPEQYSSVAYRLLLATDSEMKNIVLDETVYGTAYILSIRLKYGQSYFWRIQSVDPVISDWSILNIFHTVEGPKPAPVDKEEATTPNWALAVIGIGISMIVAVLACLLVPRLILRV